MALATMPNIHPTAIVEPGAELAEDVSIGPYCRVGPQVVLGPGTVVLQGAIVEGLTRLGKGNRIFPYAIVGAEPQDRKYQGEPSRLEIGDDNVIREHVTIHIGTEAGGGLTRIGNKNLIMAGTHVAHDCLIGNGCILANYTGLAGHVTLEDHVTLGGQTGVHQFVRIGSLSMTGGGSKVGKDIPPFTVAQGYPARLRGVNHIGLKRAGFSDETIRALRQLYRAVFNDEGRFEDLLARVREEFRDSVECQRFLDFLEASQGNRGFLRPGTQGDEGDED